MSISNFQDVVVLNSNTLTAGVEALIIGTDAGSKSIVFAQDPAQASALFLVASNPTAQQTQVLQAANGTLGLIAAISAGAAAFSNGELVFSNSNGVSFGINGSTITASVAAAAGGGVAIAAGTQTATSGTVVYSNSNLISFGMSNSSVVTASAGYIASISAGTTNATGNQVVFSNSNGISFGANGATVTAKLPTISYLQEGVWEQTFTVASNAGSLSLQRILIPYQMNATELDFLAAISIGASAAHSYTLSLAAYTMTASTLSLVSSTSIAYSWTSGSTSTVSSVYAGVSGTRWRSIPLATWNLTPGEYMIGAIFSASENGGANTATYSFFGQSAPTIAGALGGGNLSHTFGDGLFSTTTNAFPASVHLSAVIQTGASALQQPSFIVYGT